MNQQPQQPNLQPGNYQPPQPGAQPAAPQLGAQPPQPGAPQLQPGMAQPGVAAQQAAPQVGGHPPQPGAPQYGGQPAQPGMPQPGGALAGLGGQPQAQPGAANPYAPGQPQQPGMYPSPYGPQGMHGGPLKHSSFAKFSFFWSISCIGLYILGFILVVMAFTDAVSDVTTNPNNIENAEKVGKDLVRKGGSGLILAGLGYLGVIVGLILSIIAVCMSNTKKVRLFTRYA